MFCFVGQTVVDKGKTVEWCNGLKSDMEKEERTWQWCVAFPRITVHSGKLT